MSWKTQIAAVALVMTPALARAQAWPDTAGVRRAVVDYVEGFYQGDSTRFLRSISPKVFKYGYYIPRDSTKYVGTQMTWDAFHAYANRVKAQNRQRPATDVRDVKIFEVLDQTASAKLTAYWGIDYMLLAKEDGRWVVTHVLWQTPPKL
jgi:hypothetical protein